LKELEIDEYNVEVQNGKEVDADINLCEIVESETTQISKLPLLR
jgi:hypothetical protein